MKSIAHPAPDVAPEFAPKAHGRNNALDRVRTFLTVIVLVHHAVIPYTYFGHTDPKSWIGFDAVVLATDSFFMAMFFMLSGLFVWPSLARRVPWAFTRDRALRLLLPFAIAALTVIPIAYYAIALRQDPTLRFSEFWWKTVSVGPWPSGPVWFTWVLFVFDFLAGVMFRANEHSLDAVNRLSTRSFDRPWLFFLFLAAVTMIVYVPARLYFGPSDWFTFGPLSVQSSRVLLYLAYFLIGAGIGVAGVRSGVLGADGRLANGGTWGWAVLAFIPYCLLWGLIYIKRGILGNPDTLPLWYEAAYGVLFVVFSAAITFAILAYFLRYKRDGKSLLDPMQHDAYGIFLVHYPFALWIQYGLFDYDLPAIAKAAIGFVVTLAAAWATTRLLRQIPGAERVL
ncbi:MAG: acyltransferase [Xanthobacteraceae bacterium]|nr:acyltransferase [Xanthobacteraceae bacterium]